MNEIVSIQIINIVYFLISNFYHYISYKSSTRTIILVYTVRFLEGTTELMISVELRGYFCRFQTFISKSYCILITCVIKCSRKSPQILFRYVIQRTEIMWKKHILELYCVQFKDTKHTHTFIIACWLFWKRASFQFYFI